MARCDACGKHFGYDDVKKGAAFAIPDDPTSDNLCIKCNENDNDEKS